MKLILLSIVILTVINARQVSIQRANNGHVLQHKKDAHGQPAKGIQISGLSIYPDNAFAKIKPNKPKPWTVEDKVAAKEAVWDPLGITPDIARGGDKNAYDLEIGLGDRIWIDVDAPKGKQDEKGIDWNKQRPRQWLLLSLMYYFHRFRFTSNYASIINTNYIICGIHRMTFYSFSTRAMPAPQDAVKTLQFRSVYKIFPKNGPGPGKTVKLDVTDAELQTMIFNSGIHTPDNEVDQSIAYWFIDIDEADAKRKIEQNKHNKKAMAIDENIYVDDERDVANQQNIMYVPVIPAVNNNPVPVGVNSYYNQIPNQFVGSGSGSDSGINGWETGLIAFGVMELFGILIMICVMFVCLVGFITYYMGNKHGSSEIELLTKSMGDDSDHAL